MTGSDPHSSPKLTLPGEDAQPSGSSTCKHSHIMLVAVGKPSDALQNHIAGLSNCVENSANIQKVDVEKQIRDRQQFSLKRKQNNEIAFNLNSQLKCLRIRITNSQKFKTTLNYGTEDFAETCSTDGRVKFITLQFAPDTSATCLMTHDTACTQSAMTVSSTRRAGSELAANSCVGLD